MKFRDEDNLDVRVVTAKTSIELEQHIRNLADKYDLVDLQYSTTTIDDFEVEYSALALVKGE